MMWLQIWDILMTTDSEFWNSLLKFLFFFKHCKFDHMLPLEHAGLVWNDRMAVFETWALFLIMYNLYL